MVVVAQAAAEAPTMARDLVVAVDLAVEVGLAEDLVVAVDLVVEVDLTVEVGLAVEVVAALSVKALAAQVDWENLREVVKNRKCMFLSKYQRQERQSTA